MENEEREALEDSVREFLEEEFEDFKTSIEDSVEASVENGIQNLLARFELALPDGTHLIPKKQLSVTAPDKTKVLLCYGGLRVEDTSKFSGNFYPVGWGLMIQTRIDSWEMIYVYQTKPEALDALERVEKAIRDGNEFLDL